MLDSIYHMTLKILKSHFRRENVKNLRSFKQRYIGRHIIIISFLMDCLKTY